MNPLLQLSGVETHIGRYHILHGVDLSVAEGRVTMLLGRNGAGKTTTLRTIMGLWRASSGEIRFAGQHVEAMTTPDIARLGLGYVPENMGVFSDLSVKENLVLAARAGAKLADLEFGPLDGVVDRSKNCSDSALDGQIWNEELELREKRHVETSGSMTRFIYQSKHAVLGMTKAMASELGVDGITVNCVQPGAIETPMTAEAFSSDPAFAEFWRNKAALKRLGQPADIASAIAFLLTDGAGFISGHGIFVDGAAMSAP